MIVLADAFIQVVGIDGDLHHVHLAAILVHDEHAHARALGMDEDQRLLVAGPAGLANHALPSGAELLLDHAVQFVAVDRLA